MQGVGCLAKLQYDLFKVVSKTNCGGAW